MDVVRLDGNLQQLAELVRNNSRKAVQSGRDEASRNRLPEATSRIATGLSGEALPPLRDEERIGQLLGELLNALGQEPTNGLEAQAGLRQDSVLALS